MEKSNGSEGRSGELGLTASWLCVGAGVGAGRGWEDRPAGGGLGRGRGAGGLGHRRPPEQVPQQVLGVGGRGVWRRAWGLHCPAVQAQEVRVLGRGRRSCRGSVRPSGGLSGSGVRPTGPLVASVALLAGQRQHLVVRRLTLVMGTLPAVSTRSKTRV